MIEKILSRAAGIKRSTADIASGIVITILSIALLAYGIPNGISMGQAGISKGANNPRTLPYAVSTVFLVMGVLVLITGIRKKISEKHSVKAEAAQTGENESKQVKDEISFMVIAFVVAVIGIAFALLFRTVGYIPLNLIAMILMYYLFGGTKWYEAVILAVVFTGIMVGFFKYYLLINIPLGLGIG